MKSFFQNKENVKLKYIEFYKPRERYQKTVLLKTMSEIDLNISLQ